MQTTIETTEKQAKAESRRQLREEVKRQNKIRDICQQPEVESLTITIEWKKSRTWGMNPHASARVCYKNGKVGLGTARASGCGYCKRSTVIADIFNQFLRYKLLDRQVLKRFADKKPYGINLPPENAKWLPSYEGGIGEGCYIKISEAIGGSWECVAHTDRVNVYRYTENAE